VDVALRDAAAEKHMPRVVDESGVPSKAQRTGMSRR